MLIQTSPQLPLVLAVGDTFKDLPTSAHALALGALIGGLIMWAFGRRLLKPAFALAGICLGGLLGLVLVPSFAPDTILGVPSAWIGLGLGLVLGLVQAIALYRFTMAVAAAVILGVAGTLGAASWMKFEPIQRISEVAPTPVPIGEFTPPALTQPPTAEQLLEHVKPVAERVRVFAVEIGDAIAAEWALLSSKQQGILVLSGLGGVVLGLVLGLVFPSRASAVVTSLLGAAAWLPAAAWLSAATEAPWHGRLPTTAMTWLIVWVSVSTLGVLIQLSMSARITPKKD